MGSMDMAMAVVRCDLDLIDPIDWAQLRTLLVRFAHYLCVESQSSGSTQYKIPHVNPINRLHCNHQKLMMCNAGRHTHTRRPRDCPSSGGGGIWDELNWMTNKVSLSAQQVWRLTPAKTTCQAENVTYIVWCKPDLLRPLPPNAIARYGAEHESGWKGYMQQPAQSIDSKMWNWLIKCD